MLKCQVRGSQRRERKPWLVKFSMMQKAAASFSPDTVLTLRVAAHQGAGASHLLSSFLRLAQRPPPPSQHKRNLICSPSSTAKEFFAEQ